MPDPRYARRKPRPKTDVFPQAIPSPQQAVVPIGFLWGNVYNEGDSGCVVLITNGPMNLGTPSAIFWTMHDSNGNPMNVLEVRSLTVSGSTAQLQPSGLLVFYTATDSPPFRLTPSQNGRPLGTLTDLGIASLVPIYPWGCEVPY